MPAMPAHLQVRSRLRERMAAATAQKAEKLVLEALLGPHADKKTLDSFREMYRKGQLEDKVGALRRLEAAGQGEV